MIRVTRKVEIPIAPGLSHIPDPCEKRGSALGEDHVRISPLTREVDAFRDDHRLHGQGIKMFCVRGWFGKVDVLFYYLFRKVF